MTLGSRRRRSSKGRGGEAWRPSIAGTSIDPTNEIFDKQMKTKFTRGRLFIT